jgi:hemerythrin-like domain-containing protein
MSHELAEKTAGLASRVNNLAINQSGNQSRQLLEEQDRLIKLEMVAIVKDLNCEHDAYKKAIKGLNIAINAVEDADKDITKVADAIALVKKAIDLIAKGIEMAAIASI